MLGAGGGSNYGQGGPRPVHFGIGPLARVPRITVHWPSGAVQVFENVPAGTDVVAVEPLGSGHEIRFPGEWDDRPQVDWGPGPEASGGLERIR